MKANVTVLSIKREGGVCAYVLAHVCVLVHVCKVASVADG